MKIKTLNVGSVSEYFNLNKAERTWLGFYRLPESLPIESLSGEDGWNLFYKTIKKEFPIQWFFRHWMTSYENPAYYYIKRLIWKFMPPRSL